MILRQFAKSDWYGLAGAESWSDGQDPYVVYGVPVEYWPVETPDGVTVTVDALGVAVMDNDGDYLNLVQPDRDTALDVAGLILSKPINKRVLVALGFTGSIS